MNTNSIPKHPFRPAIFRVILMILVMAGFGMTAVAQLDEAQKIIYLVKAIKRIAVKQLDFPEAAGFKEENKELKFEVTAFDENDQPVNLTPEQAKEVLNVKVKNPLTSSVVDRKTISFNSDQIPNTDRYQHIVKMFTGKGQGAARLEVRIADTYSKYSKVAGRQLISTGGTPGKTSMVKSLAKNTKNMVVKHPYISGGIGAVVVGGVAVAAGGGGGGGGSGSGGGTGNTSPGGTPAAYTGRLSGGWSGVVQGVTVSGSFSMNISAGGAVSGSYSGSESGSLSGSVNGSGEMTAQGSASGGSSWSGGISVSGGVLSGSGTWAGNGGSGTWSGG